MNYSDNLWYYLLQENVHLFSDEALINVSYYTGKVASNKNRTEYVNLFNLDNRSYDDICKLINELYNKKDKVILPKSLVKDGPTIFFNEAEGHGPDEFFYSLHKLIEICQLTGYVAYKNGSVNIGKMYEEFCNEQQVIPKMTVDYSYNIGWSNPDNAHYSLPKDIPFQPLKVEDQKLYSSFNWNPWAHRLCLIGLLHYYDLLPDGYVTSPGDNKFKYDLEKDFHAINSCLSWYCKTLPEYDDIMEKLQLLKNSYPLKIDDRSKYNDTDTPLKDNFLKMPLHRARVNSLFEIVAETRFTKEHWFSEKTYWPLKLGKPFLLIVGAGSLSSLRMLGYKTFGDYIDESYDEQTSTPHKVQQVVLEMKRLKEFRDKNPIGFYEMYTKLEEIGKHNSEVFKKGHAYL